MFEIIAVLFVVDVKRQQPRAKLRHIHTVRILTEDVTEAGMETALGSEFLKAASLSVCGVLSLISMNGN